MWRRRWQRSGGRQPWLQWQWQATLEAARESQQPSLLHGLHGLCWVGFFAFLLGGFLGLFG
jgi:hypothetical protein